MSRRAVLTALLALPLLAACREKPMLGQEEPAIDPKALQTRIAALAARAAPARLGVGVQDLGTRQLWAFEGDTPFPLGGAASIPILAAVMAETEAGRLPPAEIITVRDVDLSPPPSAVADAWPARRTWSVAELETLARGGDNTALDLLTRRIEGPGGVTGWLDVKQIRNVSVDRYRRQIATDSRGLASFRADWKGESAWRAAVNRVPADQRARAARARRGDPRDTATPVGMIRLMDAFINRELVAKPDPSRLLGDDPGYLAAALPEGARIIQSAGTPPPDLGIFPTSHAVAFVELKGGRRIAFVVFLTASSADIAARQALIADVGRAVLQEF
ncbi:serine hydrolase [uncultured Caulobacter sp.]|uniref:serine hydrolase n=1 Tax=uncultured Caulobacter sp. TaxID=158749 RepID=UPI00261692D7|nr:serine hydrolase [uncultured Caulobacter sp.]